jgi:L-alanine-DL-glutamate epimerase-like enolase superfamily enzyme
MVDANGGYSRSQALRIGQELDMLGVIWFEEPVTSDDAEGLGHLRNLLGCEVAAGEYIAEIADARPMCEVVDCLQLDVTRCGGFTGWRRCAAYAHASHTPVSAHCAPALHLPLALADDRVRHIEWFSDHVALEAKLLDGAPTVGKGRMAYPQSPDAGHGYQLKDVSDFAVDGPASGAGGICTVTSLPQWTRGDSDGDHRRG